MEGVFIENLQKSKFIEEPFVHRRYSLFSNDLCEKLISNFFYIKKYMSQYDGISQSRFMICLNGDNINSGSTLPGSFITLWRREELHKVLIHELIHYLNIDMYNYQYKFYILYKDIKLDNHKCNPNEAYTEFIAILIFTFWKFKKKQ